MAALRTLVALGFVLGLGACGGAPAAKSPEPGPDDVDSLAAELEISERALLAELGPASKAPTTAPTGATTPEGGGEAAPEEKKSSEPSAPAPEPNATQAGQAKASSPCETACKALASMKRSQTRICELAGDTHARCEWAKQRVAEATTRVEQAGCGCGG